ncbi:MAG: ABC transporter substrate-binding protein [Oscillospiraceae bacterium]
MKKLSTILALLLVACLLLTACNTGSTSSSSETAPSETAPSEAASSDAPASTDDPASEESAATGEKIKIKTIEIPQDDAPDSEREMYEFNKATIEEMLPNVEIEFTRFAPGSDYRQQYDQWLMAGDEPTVGHIFPYVDIQTRIANGTIADISEFAEDWDLRKEGKVVTTFDDAITDKDGKWYAVPFQPYVNGIMYNKAVITEAGGNPSDLPATWNEFAEMAQSYTDKEVPRFGYLLLGSDWNAWTFTPWVWSAGGEMVRDNGDGTWKIAFNEDPGVDAALFMNQLIWEYNCTQKDVLETYDEMQNHFKAGQACFGWGNFLSFSVDDLARFDQDQNDMGFFALPAKDDGGRSVAFAGGEVWTMSPNATQEQKEAAWQYIQAYTYDEGRLDKQWDKENELGRLNGNPPARVDLTEHKLSKATSWPAEWADQLTAAMEVALPEPYCPNWNELKNEIAGPLQTIYLKEGITREEVQQLLDGVADSLYEKYPESFQRGA